MPIALAADGLCVCIASAAMWCLYSLGGYWVVAYDRPRRLWHGYSALAAKDTAVYGVLSYCRCLHIDQEHGLC